MLSGGRMDLSTLNVPTKLTTLLRLTRHKFLPEQKLYLEERFGRLTMIQHADSVSFDDMRRLKEMYDPDLVEVVLPVHLVERAIEIFTPAVVIKSVLKRQVMAGGKVSREFSHYERYKEVRVEMERL